MDDLIPRKDAVEQMCGINCGCTRDMCMYGDSGCAMAQFVEEIHSVPAVPLDKLCEWLDTNCWSCPKCRPVCTDGDDKECKDCWQEMLTNWMEGLDAEVH